MCIPLSIRFSLLSLFLFAYFAKHIIIYNYFIIEKITTRRTGVTFVSVHIKFSLWFSCLNTDLSFIQNWCRILPSQTQGANEQRKNGSNRKHKNKFQCSFLCFATVCALPLMRWGVSDVFWFFLFSSSCNINVEFTTISSSATIVLRPFNAISIGFDSLFFTLLFYLTSAQLTFNWRNTNEKNLPYQRNH